MESKPQEHKPLLPPSLLGKRKTIQPVSAGLERSSPGIAIRPLASQPSRPISAAVPGPAAERVPSAVVTAIEQLAPPVSKVGAKALSDGTYTSADTVAFMTGSDYQRQQQRKRLPIGIYVIVAFNILGFAGSFFNSSNSALYIFPALVNLIAAVCLLLRMEGARKVMLGIAGLTLVLCMAGFLLLAGLQQRIKQNKASYQAAIVKLETGRLTTQQKAQIADWSKEISEGEKLAGKSILYTYIYFGVIATGSIGIIAYLTRPNVREVFRPLSA